MRSSVARGGSPTTASTSAIARAISSTVRSRRLRRKRATSQTMSVETRSPASTTPFRSRMRPRGPSVCTRRTDCRAFA